MLPAIESNTEYARKIEADLASTSPQYLSKRKPLPVEVLDNITRQLAEEILETLPRADTLEDEYHFLLHCVLDTCREDAHLFKSDFFDEQAREYHQQFDFVLGDQAGDYMEDSDGEETSELMEEDHDSDCLEDRRGCRGEDEDYIERVKEFAKETNGWDDWEERVEQDHRETVQGYMDHVMYDIKELGRVLQRYFGVRILFINMAFDDLERDFSQRFIPLVWVHSPTTWTVTSNIPEKPENESKTGEKPKWEAEPRLWYNPDSTDSGLNFYANAATLLKSEDVDQERACPLQHAIKTLGLSAWLHPMQYWAKDAVEPQGGDDKNVRGPLLDLIDDEASGNWPRLVEFHVQTDDSCKDGFDGMAEQYMG